MKRLIAAAAVFVIMAGIIVGCGFCVISTADEVSALVGKADADNAKKAAELWSERTLLLSLMLPENLIVEVYDDLLLLAHAHENGDDSDQKVALRDLTVSLDAVRHNVMKVV